MKKIVTLCFLMALMCVKGWGQTVTAINPATDGGFELGTTFADNGWSTALDGNNKWYLGTVAKTAGLKGAYIDANGTAGTANTYNMSATRVSYIYKDVPIPAGATNIVLSFKWRAVGENGSGADSYDFLRVFLVPNTTTISAGALLSSGSIIGLGKYNLSSSTTFSTAAPITISNAVAGTTQRLAFCWRNDGSDGSNPPAAVDEISLTYTPPPPPANDECSGAITINTATTCSSTSGTSVGATASTGFPASSCTVTGTSNDVWYKITADGVSTYTVIADPVAAAEQWSVAVYNGSCGSFTTAAQCTEGAANGGTVTLNTGVLSAGVHYYRIFARSGATGAFTTCVTYSTPAPTITSFTPTSGCVGTSVAITGTNFTPSSTVKFNGVTATSVTVNSTTSITATVPASATTGTISVTTTSTTVATSPSSFTVNTAPSITTQPQPQTSCAGSTATFSVTASGTSLSYQWRKNGSDISGANGASYTTPALTVADNGAVYSVLITNSCNPTGLASSNATLTVNTPASITAQPQSQTKCAGEPVTFSVTATGSPLSYQWRKNGVNVPSGGTSSSYTINSVAAADAGSYDVVVSVAGCTPPATSTAATLTVNTAPSITTQPQAQTSCVGSTATFSVTASGTAPLTYQWRQNGSDISGANGASYTTPALTAADNGAVYSVLITNSCNPTGLASSNATLTVNAPAVISTNPASQTVCAGQTATFSVALSSGTSPTYQWRKNGANVGTNSPSYTTPATVAGDNGATYDVVVTVAGCGSVTSTTATLTVNTAAAITTQPQPQTSCVGSTATFSVVASGTAPFTYQWRKNGSDISGATNSSYTTPTLTAADNNTNYSVVVKNSCNTTGATSNAVTLTVNTPANISGQPQSQTKCVGDPVTFSVTLSAGTSPTYQWRKNGINVPSGGTLSSYTISSVNASSAGTFDVVVTVANCGSVTSDPATLTVNTAATITTQPQAQTSCVGSTATFSVVAGGTAPFTYQWRKNGSDISGATNSSYTTPTLTAADNNTNYSVVVKNSCNTTGATSNSVTLTVNTPPTVTTNPTDQSTCVGSTTATTFTIAASGTTPSYTWQYSTSTNPNSFAPVVNGTPAGVTYTGTNTSSLGVTTTAGTTPAGNYYYRCIVTVSSCESSVASSSIAKFTVNALPTATISYSGSPYCSTGGTANVTRTGTLGGTYSSTPALASLNTSNGDINLATSPAGTYSIKYTFSNGTCSNSTTTSVTINTAPSISGQPANKAICTGQTGTTFSVTASGTAPLTYQWQFSSDGGVTYATIPNTTINGYTFSGANTATLSVTAGSSAAPGTYYVKCVVGGAAPCASVTSNPATLTVNGTLSGLSYTTASASYCTGTAIAPNTPSVVTGTGSITYSINPSISPTGLSFNTSTGVISGTPTAASPATTYTVTAQNTCGNVQTTLSIAVNASPTITSVTATPAAICPGGSSNLAVVVPATSPVTIVNYDFNNGSSYGALAPALAANITSNFSGSTIDFDVNTGTATNGSAFTTNSTPGNALYAIGTFYGGDLNGTKSWILSLGGSNLSSYTSFKLYFQVQSSNIGGPSPATVNVSYSLNGGMSYITTGLSPTSVTPGADTYNSGVLAFPAGVDNPTSLLIKLTPSNSIFGSERLDNVQVQAVPVVKYSWTASPSGASAGLPPTASSPLTTNNNITVSPSVTTTYTVTETNINNCPVSANTTVTVKANTAIALSSAAGTDAQTHCAGETITPITYQVTGGGTLGASTTSTLPSGVTGSFNSTTGVYTISGTIAATESGSFPYTITATGDCASPKTINGVINVNALPAKVNFTPAAGAVFYCTDADGNNGDGYEMIIDASEVGVNYDLLFNGTTVIATEPGTGNPINFGYQLPAGTYSVRGTNATTGCTRIVTNQANTLTIRQRPAHFTVTVNGAVAPSVAVCSGNSFIIGLNGTQSGTTYRLTRNSVAVGSAVTGTGGPLSFPAQTVAGTYGVYANSTCGFETMDGQVIATVNPRPTPTFTAAPSGSYCSGQNSVTYTTQSGSGENSYVWTVPGTQNINYIITSGGITSTDNTVTLTWLTAGSKTVTVNYNNSFGCNGTSAATNTITINQTPVIANKTTTAACSGAFSITPATGGGDIIPIGTTYSWSAPSGSGFTGGATGTNQSSISGTLTNTTNATVTAVYTVTATSGSCTSSFTVTVTVNPVPFIAPKTAAICSGGTFTVTPANGTDIVPTNTTYSWGVPNYSNGNITGGVAASGQTSISGTLTNSGATAGTATYNVTATSGSCTSSFTVTVTVNPLPTATVAAASSSVCEGSGGSFIISGTPNSTVYYDLSTGASSSETLSASGSATVLVGFISGSVTITLTNATSSEGCNRALSGPNTTATITTKPVPVASVLAGPNTCEGTGVSFTFSGTANTDITYSIAVNGGSPVVQTQPVHIPSNGANVAVSSSINAGTYTYTITNVDLNGCSGTPGSTATGYVNPAPSISLTSAPGSDNPSICKGTSTPISITFNVTSAGTPIVSGLPAGVTDSYSNGVLTISGTPTTTGAYPYTIAVPGGACTSPAPYAGTITLSVQWTGSTDITWNVASNWCGNVVPSATDYVTITPVPNQPSLTGDETIGGLGIASGATVTIGSHTLEVDGAISGNGTITGSSASNLTVNGTGTVNFTAPSVSAPLSNTLQNLTVNGGTLTLGNALNITAGTAPGVVTVASGATLGTADNLTLKSDPDGTAAVAANNGSNYITGNVTVERYIGLNPNNGSIHRTGRAWRLLTAPLQTTGVTIHDAWQEGATSTTDDPHPGYGTIITGEGKPTYVSGGTISSSFDYVASSAHHTSIRQYLPNATGGNWSILPGNSSTGTGIDIRSAQAWMLFVRGDRGDNTKSSAGFTTLRSKGLLNQGGQTSITIPGTGTSSFTLIGNPYPAPLDLEQVYSSSTGITHQFTVWNSNLSDYGAYEVIDGSGGNNNYIIVPNAFEAGGPSSNSQFLQSGQGFFVQPAGATNGSVTITESAKAPTQTSLPNPFREVPVADKKLWVNLKVKDNDTSSRLADGFLARFDASYTGDIDEMDSRKLTNFNENLGISSHGSNLIIESRPDVQKADTLFVRMWNVAKRNYQLQMKADNFASAPGIGAWLVDNYLGTKQAISLAGGITTINFSVTSDTSSSKSDRFLVVFQNSSAALPVTLTSVKAQAQNGGVSVSWTVTNETNIRGYTIEKSTDGGTTYTSVGTQAAKNNAAAAITTYQGFDAQPKAGDNLYRIRIEAKDGAISYSQVVKVVIGDGNGIQIVVYPNPVRGGKINVQLTNLKAGNYLASLYSSVGQSVYQRKIAIGQPGITQSEELKIGNSLAQGSYQLRISDSKGTVVQETKLVIAH